ncbi:MAG: non-canonical purine NTP diphosphatase [Bacteroidota bacterium]
MKKLVFATSNPNKIREVKELLGDNYQFLGLPDIGCTEDVPETQPTIEGNAIQKAEYVNQNYQVDCFAEDTGLEVDALNGAPGVITARYAGEQRDANANMDLLLKNLSPFQDRSAQFKTVIALILDGQMHTFEGIIRGKIATERMGNKGFGYDPIFIPNGYDVSFAQMEPQLKNEISHRGLAIKKLQAFLSQLV